MCGITVVHDGHRVHSIRGDAKDAFSGGHVCPKVMALRDLHEDPDRLKQPIRRTADGWETIGWDTALDYVASELRRIRMEQGRDAIGIYYGNPTGHNHGAMIFLQAFFAAVGSRNRFSASSVDQLPQMVVAKEMFGHPALLPIPDLERTDYLVIMGGNPCVSMGSIMSAGDIRGRLSRLRSRGGTVVVIDPRRTETARVADRHLFIRPGTDALLLLGILHVIFEEGLSKPGPLAGDIKDLDIVRSLVSRYDPASVSGPTGVETEAIGRLAREFAKARTAVWYGRMGTSTNAVASLNHWLINLINLVTGRLDAPGGVMFTTPAADIVGLDMALKRMRRRRRSKTRRSRVRGLPAFLGEWPVATLADEILSPGEGQIRAMVTFAGNPVLATPNGRRLDEALTSLDFMVAIDFYLNETTRHANVILPPTVPLERDHFDLLFHTVSIRNTVKYSPALFEPGPDQRHDWEILRDLSIRLGLDGSLISKLVRRPLARIRPEHVVDVLLRIGRYGALARPLGPRLTLKKLLNHPHGLDLGPNRPTLRERLMHADGKVHAAPKLLLDELPRIDAIGARAGLLLFGRRDLRSKNSWLHNCERLVKGKDRCTAQLHPLDAHALGIEGGMRVEVASRVGSIELVAEVTEDVCPGTVCVPHGWGHARPGTRMRVAEAHAGVSVNDIVDEREVDAVSGTSVLNGLEVRVLPARVEGNVDEPT